MHVHTDVIMHLCICLQALLPWVTGSFSEEEKEAMMGSLREATKNTMFDQWLGAVQQSGAAAAAAAGAAGGGSAAAAAAAAEGQQQQAAAAGAGPERQQQQMAMSDLAEIAEYLTGSSSGSLPQQQQQLPGLLPSVPQPLPQQQCQTEVSGTIAESTNYVPGWEDIFNINQKQLEAAIRRVSNDPNLEPQRKAYLIQNIMVSRYIVAQQRRMQTSGSAAAAGAGQLSAGQMLPPPLQQQQQHVHSQQQQQQGVQHSVPVQQSTSSSVLPQQHQQQPVRTYADASAGVLGCKHYRRSAQLVAPCCGKVYTCRYG
jgi:zinc finger-like protein